MFWRCPNVRPARAILTPVLKCGLPDLLFVFREAASPGHAHDASAPAGGVGGGLAADLSRLRGQSGSVLPTDGARARPTSQRG